MIKPFLFGAIALGYLIISLFFLRFWKKIQDRLFCLFGWAFIFLAVERIAFIWLNPSNENAHYLYFFRLIAFLLIGVAIIDKNRVK